MPSPPYAKALAILNGGAPQSGGITAPPGATVQLLAESTVDWRSWRWEMLDYPPGFVAPEGWTLDANGTIFSIAVTPKSFVLPDASTAFGKWLLQLTVNDGIDADGRFNPTKMVDDGTAIETLSPFGLRDLAAGENRQFGGRKSWVGPWQDNIRRINSLLGPIATPAGSGFPHITNGAYDAEARLVHDADIVGPIDPAKVNLPKPTGTGFAHLTGSAYDAAAKLVEDADVAPAAKIASSKIAFGAGIVFPSGAAIGALDGPAKRLLVTGEIRGNPANFQPLSFGGAGVPVTGGAVTLTPDQYAPLTLLITGALTAPAEVVLPLQAGYAKLVLNRTSGAFAVTVSTPGGPKIPIPRGGGIWVYCDGTSLHAATPANGIVAMQAVHLAQSALYNLTTLTDVPGLAIALPAALAGDQVRIDSIMRLTPNTGGFSAESVVVVVDGASTVPLMETFRSRVQTTDDHVVASTIYTVASPGILTVKQQYRSGAQSQFISINVPSSLLATHVRP